MEHLRAQRVLEVGVGFFLFSFYVGTVTWLTAGGPPTQTRILTVCCCLGASVDLHLSTGAGCWIFVCRCVIKLWHIQVKWRAFFGCSFLLRVQCGVFLPGSVHLTSSLVLSIYKTGYTRAALSAGARLYIDTGVMLLLLEIDWCGYLYSGIHTIEEVPLKG